MANNKQFTNLPAVTTLADGDIIPVQTVAGDTSKITKANLKATLGDQGITAIVEDTSPQLGGDLDGQSTYKIENIASVNGITITEGAGTLTLNDNTLSVTGADVIINASDETTITFPDTTGTILVDDDTTVTIPNATTITSTANGDVYTLPTATGTLALTEDSTQISSGTSAPATTPTKVGDIFVDTSAKKLYFATGTSSSSDWTIAN